MELASERFYNGVAPGEVSIGDVWTFRGHGGGIRFERAGITVDAHVAPHIHCAIDAWRIELYLDSIQAPPDSSGSPLEHLLEQMVATRRLVAVDVSLGATSCRMYVPSFAPSN